jgi:hypothetical protein
MNRLRLIDLKWMVMGCGVLGLIGCILGCTAQTINTLIAANVMNGLAAAGQLSFGIILGELVPNKMRGPIVTVVFLSSAPFAGKSMHPPLPSHTTQLLIRHTVFGPAIARAFILHTSSKWRWSYYLGVIFSVISLALYQFFYHPPTYKQLHVQGLTKRQQLKNLDWGGLFLFIAAMTLSLIGLSWGGGVYPWASKQVLSTLIVGILLFGVMGIYGMLQSDIFSRLFKY